MTEPFVFFIKITNKKTNYNILYIRRLDVNLFFFVFFCEKVTYVCAHTMPFVKKNNKKTKMGLSR